MTNKFYNLIIILGLSLICQFTFGQVVFEQDNPMSLGLKPGHVVKMPLEKVKDGEKVWLDYMKEIDVKIKKNRKADEHYAENIDLYSIGNGNTFNLYSRVQKATEGTELLVWIDLGSRFMTGEDGEGYRNLQKLLNEVEKASRVENQNIILEEEEENLKTLNKNLSKLESNKEKYEKTIEKAKATIVENEANIETNLNDQEKAKAEIEAQAAKMEGVKNKIAEIKAGK